MRILIVEDDDDIRAALAEALEFEDYFVHVESNGLRAFEWLRHNPRPSVILLDLVMPVMDGFAFRAQQLKLPELATIPVIVITASRATIDESHGFNAVLKKPLLVDSLTAALGSIPKETGAWASEATKPVFRK
jgi:CheY-like chemotaxis protein